jgi:copper chaperone NosL
VVKKNDAVVPGHLYGPRQAWHNFHHFNGRLFGGRLFTVHHLLSAYRPVDIEPHGPATSQCDDKLGYINMSKYWQQKGASLILSLLTICFLIVPPVLSRVNPHEIEAHKECPLCGMFPARYSAFQCQIIFKDGTYEAFDSPAGLLAYLLFPDKTGMPHQTPAKVFFRDFVSGKWIDSQTTFFVVGSGIMGPMGIDFLPVAGRKTAEILMQQEKGQHLISYTDVNRQFMIRAANSTWLHYLAQKIVLQ